MAAWRLPAYQEAVAIPLDPVDKRTAYVLCLHTPDTVHIDHTIVVACIRILSVEEKEFDEPKSTLDSVRTGQLPETEG